MLCHFLFPKEQEEEMSCWEGAEGSAAKSQRRQSESELGHELRRDDAKMDELPGPKFRSLRHLRQVNFWFNSFTFAHIHSYHQASICCFQFVLQVLGAAEFRQLVWHVLMGNQVIWRGADPGLIQSAFTVLKVYYYCVSHCADTSKFGQVITLVKAPVCCARV